MGEAGGPLRVHPAHPKSVFGLPPPDEASSSRTCALSDLAGLRRLDLRGNALGDLRPLRGLPSLLWVHVGASRIEDLAPLEGLRGLTVAGRDDLDSPGAAIDVVGEGTQR